MPTDKCEAKRRAVRWYTVLNANEDNLIRIRIRIRVVQKKLAFRLELYRPVHARIGIDGDVHTSLLVKIVGDLVEDVREPTEVLGGDLTDDVENVIVIV